MTEFEWDSAKDFANKAKHGVSFFEAQAAFEDPRRAIALDVGHSIGSEERFSVLANAEAAF